MTEFKKETRYIVMKMSDVDRLPRLQRELLTQLCDQVDRRRRKRQSQHYVPLECVVVESDWRCYDTVWDIVEAEHTVNESRSERQMLEDDSSWKLTDPSWHDWRIEQGLTIDRLI